MATKRWILLLLAAAMMAVLAGCSGGSTANVQNPQPPPQSQVTIAFQAEPAGSLPVNGSENLTAVVTNDPNNYGVDWSLACPNGVGAGNCGQLCLSTNTNCGNATVHTASCATPPTASCTVTYTAPASIPTNSLVVQVVALATANQASNVVAPITVGSFDSSLPAGNYVLQAQGFEGIPYQFAAVVTLDGAGNVTGGEQAVNANGVSVTDQNLSGSYFIGGDGRGTITIVDPNSAIGTEVFALVFLTNSHSQNPQALISQIGIDNTGASATGTMDWQHPTAITAAPSGSYAFVMCGTDVDVLDSIIFPDGPPPLAFGGVLDIGSSSSQTAISGVIDEFIADHLKLADVALSTGSQISAGPDTFGQFTVTLAGLTSYSQSRPVTVVLTGYIVDASHIRLIETDNTATTAGFGTTGGLAIGQVAGSYGTFNNGSMPSGTTYVFGVTGMDLSPNSGSYTPSSLSSVGLFTANGSGALSNGFTDTFLLFNCVQPACIQLGSQGAQISSSFTGTYAVDTGGADPGSGTGRTT